MLRPSLQADPRHGPLPMFLLARTFVSGVVDAVSVLALGRVFVANMTGNVIFIGFALAGAPGFSLLASVAALVGFVVGAVAGGGLVDRSGTRRDVLLRNIVATELVLIAICLGISLVVHLRDTGPIATVLVAGLAAVAMGLQNAAARRVAVPDMTTSVLTMTLAGLAADHLHPAPGTASRRCAVILALFAGGAIGALLVLRMGSHMALGVVVVVLVGVLVTATLASRVEAPWQQG